MPISVKKHIAPVFGLKGKSYSLKTMKNFRGGSVLNHVKEDVADEIYSQFHCKWDVHIAFESYTARNLSRELARKFNLKRRDDIFNTLWEINKDSDKFKKNEKNNIKKDLILSYENLAHIANGESVEGKTFDRVIERDDKNFVVFSDLHMMNLKTLPNYFKNYNYKLYLKVLDHYSTTDYCLVENGDIEECLIYDPDLKEAEERVDALGAYPIEDNDDWNDFLTIRYNKRLETLNHVIDSFPDYYATIKNRFIGKKKYVRLTGNHDTYLNEPFERDLKNRIENELGISVADILRIKSGEKIDYIVMHGHQFDSVCLQHGDVPYAKSLGENYSENVSWAYQGPDRVWESKDVNNWTVGNEYTNKLAVGDPRIFDVDPNDGIDEHTKPYNALALKQLKKIKGSSKGFIESALEHEIAWEYFENDSKKAISGYLSLALEVLTGDEMFKFRHMNEVDLCKTYEKCYQNLKGNKEKTPPTLILGHTHEPRQGATVIEDNVMKPCHFYLNSGSAGRYENLIWAVEIRNGKDFIVSWSFNDDRKLQKTTWRSGKGRLYYLESDVEVITKLPFQKKF